MSVELVVVGGRLVERRRRVATRLEHSPNGLVPVGAVVMEPIVPVVVEPIVPEALAVMSVVGAMVVEWESLAEDVLVSVPVEARCRIQEKADVVGRIASVGERVVVVAGAKWVVACEGKSLACVRSWETYVAGWVLWALSKEVVV